MRVIGEELNRLETDSLADSCLGLSGGRYAM